MPQRIVLALSLLLLAAPACRDSTGIDCPPNALDCNRPTFRVYVLTVRVNSQSGAPVSGASVRVETLIGNGSGFFRTEATSATGDAVFDFSYQGDRITPPQPINVIVTPPASSSLSGAVVADTVVMRRTETFRVLPIALQPVATPND